MGSLSALAAAIERKPIADDIDPALARRNAATADAIRAAGVPDAFNRFLPENEHLNMKPPGPKEAQLRSLRISPKTFAAADKVTAAIASSTPTAPAPATKPATPAQPPVATQETTMKSKTSKKTPAKKTSKPKTRKATKKPAAARATPAPARKPATPKPGKKESKADIIERMLKGPAGTTRKALSEATGYPYVNLTMAEKRAEGFKLVEADERVQLVPIEPAATAPAATEAPAAK